MNNITTIYEAAMEYNLHGSPQTIVRARQTIRTCLGPDFEASLLDELFENYLALDAARTEHLAAMVGEEDGYIAMDSAKSWYWYSDRPISGYTAWDPINQSAAKFICCDATLPKDLRRLSDWETSLRKI